VPRGNPGQPFRVRLTDDERARIERGADRAGIDLATFVRGAAMAVAGMSKSDAASLLRTARRWRKSDRPPDGRAAKS
jgi:uncharacterized protein (DUF1778 family)